MNRPEWAKENALLQFTITLHLVFFSATLVNFHFAPAWLASFPVPVEHYKNNFGAITVELTTGPSSVAPVSGSRAVTTTGVPNTHLAPGTVSPLPAPASEPTGNDILNNPNAISG